MSGARDFSTEFLKILERLREPISEHQKKGLRAEIAALNPVGITYDEIVNCFMWIYDGFHADIDTYATQEEKMARAALVREFYKGLAGKLLLGQPRAYAAIPLTIYQQRKAETAAKKAKNAKEQEEIAIKQLMTDALVEAVVAVEGGGRKKRKTRSGRKRRSTRRSKH
jgi:hypothetical protein